jgi:hypothetical protein
MVDSDKTVIPSGGTPDEANHAVTVGATKRLSLAVDKGNVVKPRTSQCSGLDTILEAASYHTPLS